MESLKACGLNARNVETNEERRTMQRGAMTCTGLAMHIRLR